MTIAVGIDVAKEVHWVTAIDEDGGTLLDRRVENEPAELDHLLAELRAFDRPRRIGVDLLGGVATLLCATLLDAGETLVHVPGLAVNRAREGTVGGQSKSDPRDARVIADQVRTRTDLRTVELEAPALVRLRLLVAHRRDLVTEQTRRLARLHELLTSIHPGLERRLDLTIRAALELVRRYASPTELRAAGLATVRRQLRTVTKRSLADRLAEEALAAAAGQRLAVPGEEHIAAMCHVLAGEALEARTRIDALEAELAEAVAQHPQGTLIRSLPGMGVTMTAEFLAEVGSLRRFRSADALASAAGLAPVLRQSGRVRFLRRAARGDKVLKRVFYQSAFCSLRHATSRAFYERKRSEGKRHHQAVLALARRRVDVLWAMLRDDRAFTLTPEANAQVLSCATH